MEFAQMNIPMFPPCSMNVGNEPKATNLNILCNYRVLFPTIIKKHLDQWHVPLVDISIHKNGAIFTNIRAMLDPGCYYNMVNPELLFKIKEICTEKGFTYNQLDFGNYMSSAAILNFSFDNDKNIFASPFIQYHNKFEYDIILGSHFIKHFNLNILDKENRFELILN